MRDDESLAQMRSKKDLIFGLLVHQLTTGTPNGQELAAAAIWKACAMGLTANTRGAIPGLISLLKTGDQIAQTQAAGALRSTCVTDYDNKLEFNREGGVKALVDVIRARSGAAEQIANSCEP
ncbi:hypothetical protein T484DRAFT_1802692 [Baffinella frigidus]|nr:hypothetical protein T484DRAFT_1802692 [Cryptophyta sp. CCMP2293]